LVTAHLPGDENAGVGNYRQSDVREVHLYTVYDAPQAARGTLRWDVFHLDGRILQRGEKTVALKPGASVRQRVLDFGSAISQHGRDSLYVRIALEMGNRRVSEETVFLSPPRFLSLPRADTAVRITLRAALLAEITFESNAFQHRFAFELTGLPCRCSDNYFELYPGEPKVVMVQLEKPATLAHLKRALSYRSLVDTYPHHE
jgi:beta-mannosidase